MKKISTTFIVFTILAFLTLPVLYASGCNCDNDHVECFHETQMYRVQKIQTCHQAAAEQKNSTDCSQEIPCELVKTIPSDLILARDGIIDFSKYQIQLVMLLGSGQDDLDPTQYQQKVISYSFLEKGSFTHHIFLICESFLC